MDVRTVMQRDVHCVRASESLFEAAKRMWDHDCGCLPVLDDTGDCNAMITDRDICMAAFITGRPLRDIRVAEACSKRLVSCLDSDDIEDAEALMRMHRRRRLPVFNDEGELAGILSLTDLARKALVQRRQLPPTSVVETLASICERAPNTTGIM